MNSYPIYTLDDKLVYEDVIISQNPSNLSIIVPVILVSLVVIIALAALIIGVFYFSCDKGKKDIII